MRRSTLKKCVNFTSVDKEIYVFNNKYYIVGAVHFISFRKIFFLTVQTGVKKERKN